MKSRTSIGNSGTVFSTALLGLFLLTGIQPTQADLLPQDDLSTLTPCPAPSGLVAWWQAEDNAADQLGTHDGTTPFGMAYVAGTVGRAFDFDGSSRRVSVPDSPDFKLTNGMTLEGWVYPRQYQGFITFRGDNRGGLDTWTLDAYQPGFVNFQIDDTTNGYASVLAPLQLNQWQHVAATWDRATGDMKVFINGTLIAQTNTTIIPIADLEANGAVGIGNHGGTFHQFPFNGLIDELAIYNRALGSGEIAAIHQAGSSGKCPPPEPPPACDLPVGIVSWWKSEGDATDAISKNDGTLSNVVFASGKVGQAFDFNGTSSAITVPASSNLAVRSLTIEAWVNPRSVNVPRPIVEYSTPTGLGAVHLWYGFTAAPGGAVTTSGGIYGAFRDPNGAALQVGTAAGVLPANQWTHVALTYDYDSRVALIYANGLLVASNQSAVPMNMATDVPVNIGYRPPGSAELLAGRRHDGLLDEVSIYNRALGSNEIAAIYNAGSAGKCLPPEPPPACELPDGIVSWWKAENNALDSIASYHGVNVGNVGYATAKVGMAFDLNGSNYISVADAPALNPTNAITVEGWIFRQAVMGPYDPIVKKSDVTQKNGYALEFVGNNLQFWVYNNSWRTSGGSVPIALGQWYHVAGVYDGTKLACYTNGVLAASVTTSGTLGVSTNELRIGNDPANPTLRFFKGLVDEASVYNRALGSNEIVAIYNAGSAGKCLPPEPPPACELPEGIVSWWQAESNGMDSIGTNTMVLNTGASFATGKVGQAFDFDGVQGYTRAAASPSLNVGTGGGFTVEAWINPDDTGNGHPIVEWNGGAGSNYGVHFWLGHPSIGPGYLFANIVTTSGNWMVVDTAPGAVVSGVYQHVALTYDKASGMARILVNGAVVGEKNLGPLNPQTSYPVYIGRRPPGDANSRLFAGAIDEVSIYNRALGSNEIAAIYAAGSSGKCPPPPACQLPSGIAAWWKAESNALDSVGMNHGTLQNNVAFAAGRVGQSFAFDGNGDAVGLGNPESLRLQNFTIESWVKRSSATAATLAPGQTTASFLVYGQGGYGFGMYNDGSVFLTRVGIDNVTIPNLVTDTNWHHLAVSKNGSDVVFYVDGKAHPAPVPYLSTFTFTSDVAIGARGDNLGNGFLGLLDELSVYNRALGSNEIAAIYAAGSSGKCPVSPGAPPVITQQPVSQSVVVGDMVQFQVGANGAQPLAYQWTKNGQALGGATNNTLMLVNVQSSDAAPYAVLVANPFGSVTSRVASLTVNPPPVCTAVPEGVVAWWPGESNLFDVVNGFDGSVSRTMSYSTGFVGRAFVINSINGFAAPVAPELNLGSGPGFTFESWINPTSVTGTYSVCGWGGSGQIGVPTSPIGVNLRIASPGILEAQLVRSNGLIAVLRTAPGTLQLRQWQHVALSCNTTNGLMSILLNGVSVAQTNLGPTALRTLGAFRVGSISAPAFSGLLDEPTLYGRALSQPEIAAIYLADEAGKCPLPPQPCLEPALDMAAWWRGESNTVDSVFTNNLKIMPTNKPLSFSYTAGKVGNAFWQRGNDHLEAPAAPALDVGAGQGMTVEAWVYPDQFRAQPFVEWNSGTGTRGVGLGYAVTAPVLEADLVDVAGVSHIIRSPTGLIGSGFWQHLAVTYNRSNGIAALYFNGTAVAVTNLGVFTPRTTGNLYLGYRPPGAYTGSGSRFVGRIDEVALHARALTADEVREAYRNRLGRCTEAPLIVEQPASQVVAPGELVEFDPAVTGNPLLRYQWFKDGLALVGANSRQLTLPAVSASDEGVYQLVVSNNFGFATSSNAVLVINQPPLADASATELLLISPNGSNAVAVLDGSLSSDPDGDALAYEWFRVGESNAFATGVVAIVNLPLGSNALSLMVDDGWATDADDLIVEVITTAQAIDRLTALAEAGDRPQPLIASLRAALASIDRSQPAVAINQLEAFKNKVLAQVMPVDPELAAQLLADAQAIIDALNGGPAVEVVAVEITSISKGSNGKPKLTLRGNNKRTHVVEVSTNLVEWTPVGVAGKCGDCEFEFEDGQSAAGGARFYRVVSPK